MRYEPLTADRAPGLSTSRVRPIVVAVSAVVTSQGHAREQVKHRVVPDRCLSGKRSVPGR